MLLETLVPKETARHARKRGGNGWGLLIATLLHIAGLLEHQDAGEVFIDDVPTSTLNDAERTRIRRNEVGFVYQAHHLLNEFTAVENVMLPQMIQGLPRKEASERAVQLLSYLGLKERLHHRPAELSGGEQQRVAIARAIVTEPTLLLADEPTGNLDSRTSIEVMALFQALNAQGITIVVVTHEPDVAAYASRIVMMRDGQVLSDKPVADRRNAVADLLERDRTAA